MASSLYTLNWVQWQGLAAGGQIYVGPNVVEAEGVPVITDITAYCGNPNPAASNSIIIVSLYTPNGQPTLWAYHSGTTESVNPIFVSWSGRLVFDPIPVDPNPVNLFTIVNTLDPLLGGGTWDITVSGWWLSGGPALDVFRGL